MTGSKALVQSQENSLVGQSAGNAKLQFSVQTRLYIHHLNPDSSSIIFNYNGASTSFIPTGGSTSVSVFSAANREDTLEIPISISTTTGTVYGITQEIVGLPCDDQHFNNIFIHPATQTEAVTTSWDWGYVTTSGVPTCEYFHDTFARANWINFAQAPGNMWRSELSTDPNNPGGVSEVIFKTDDLWESNPRDRRNFNVVSYDFNTNSSEPVLETRYTYLHYREFSTGDSVCRRCSLTWGANATGQVYFAFWGGSRAVSLRTTTTAAGIVVSCITTSVCVTPKKDEENICFHGDSKVLLESGETKAMRDVKLGESVQVSSFDGSLSFSPVVFIPHRPNEREAMFVTLTTKKGRSIRMTSGHLVMATTTCQKGDSSLIRAEDVATGTCLVGAEGLEAVVSAVFGTAKGVYTLVTGHTDGLLVVDGIQASSFGKSHTAVNMFYHIHRALYFSGFHWLHQSSLFISFNEMLGDVAALIVDLLESLSAGRYI
eukprot:CAMPEP_0184478192 /NCGR_PEP_ID=MMETSP0113_2-20130426/283_1 /TAXON_ID=91329 /ORGANISM="Norrisiella sphaerica, Strain BC52" /LENGTH=487 /DNA_ID=CAMNT_0026855891 /DNA_START=328 /DNA_END=1791 /DNA_ORIENTATION=+